MNLLNFANILKTRHPKVDITFEIPLQTTIIKGTFGQLRTEIQNLPHFIKGFLISEAMTKLHAVENRASQGLIHV